MKALKHPKALWWLSLIYACYAVSYGVLFANLLLFSDQAYYLHFSEAYAFEFFASFSTLTFVFPLLGGFLCDRFGFKCVAKLGLSLVFIGLLVLAIKLKVAFYIGIALCLTGNALAMPSIWSMVGLIYQDNQGYREAGATLFYLIFNIGFFIAFSFSGVLATHFSYACMFILFSLGALLGYIVLCLASKTITGLPKIKSSLMRLLFYVFIIFLLCLCLLYLLFINNVLMWLITLSLFVYLYVLSRREQYQQYHSLIKAFMGLCVLGIIGMTIYNSEFGLLPEFAKHAVTLNILTIQIPPQAITGLDPLFCIILGLILSRIWIVLAAKGSNPKLATKLSMGIIIPALGYLLLASMLIFEPTLKSSVLLLIPIFAFFVIGELLVIPIGIAMASKLAPPDKKGLFMGIWNVMQGFSALLTGYIAYFTVVDIHQSLPDINLQYAQVFLYSGLIILLTGIVAFFTRNIINRLL